MCRQKFIVSSSSKGAEMTEDSKDYFIIIEQNHFHITSKNTKSFIFQDGVSWVYP